MSHINDTNLRVMYRAPDANPPNEWLRSERMTLQEVISQEIEIKFHNGGYLTFDEVKGHGVDEEVLWLLGSGAYDANAREIFQGDIIQAVEVPAHKYEVVYRDGHGWGQRATWNGFYTDFLRKWGARGYRIIGNRFLNPELLDVILDHQ